MDTLFESILIACEPAQTTSVQGTFCKTKIPNEAEPLNLMVYKGEQDTLKYGQVSTAPLRDTIIGMFDDYGLPTMVLLWLVVVTNIVVMMVAIVVCRVVWDKKRK